MSLDTILKAIEDYFGDTSLSKEECLKGLEEISSKADIFADAIRESLD